MWVNDYTNSYNYQMFACAKSLVVINKSKLKQNFLKLNLFLSELDYIKTE